jgi:hypothetical protein
MTRGKRTIRASEIGAFLYCHRAWWYQRQGFRSMNRDALDAGSEFHDTNAGNVQVAAIIRFLAWALVLFALFYLSISLF